MGLGGGVGGGWAGGLGAEGGHGPPTFGQQLCFLEIFIPLTSELMLKNRIGKCNIVISFNIFSVRSASLYNTLWPRIFQATSYMNT